MIPSGLGIGLPHQCYEDYGMDLDAMLETLQLPWWYSWKADCIGRPGFVPMLWDGNVERMAEFTSVVSAAAELPDMVFLWNEPESAKQANMTPTEAVTAKRETVHLPVVMG
jgi:hypothetical protein